MTELGGVYPEIAGWKSELTDIRREIHQNPEIGFETDGTVRRIVSILRDWGVEESRIDDRSVKGGVIVVVDGREPGPTVALRADIDALPMDDTSGTRWRSRVPGASHACGHDGHLTWLLGAVRYLFQKRDFAGRVVAVFQPAEELGEGAKAVVAAGILGRYSVREIIGAHDDPAYPKGVYGIKSGPLQASSDIFHVKVKGVSCHGGRPHQGVDPIPTGCQIVNALQTIVSRKINPAEAAVVSVCSLNAGAYETLNVIPPCITMSGIVRTFSHEVRALAEKKFTNIVNGIALANDCTAEIDYEALIPAVINDSAIAECCAAAARRLFGEDCVRTDVPLILGAEDFSVYQAEIPGLIIRVGVRDEDHTAVLHNQAFDFNDEVIPAAATLLAATATDRLRTLSEAA